MSPSVRFLALLLPICIACGSGPGNKKNKGKKKSPKTPVAEQTERAQIKSVLKVKLDGPALKRMTALGEEISVDLAVWDLPMDPKVFREQHYDLGSAGGDVHMKPLYIDADKQGNTPVEFQIQVISARKKVETNLLHCTPVGLSIADVPKVVNVNCSLI